MSQQQEKLPKVLKIAQSWAPSGILILLLAALGVVLSRTWGVPVSWTVIWLFLDVVAACLLLWLVSRPQTIAGEGDAREIEDVAAICAVICFFLSGGVFSIYGACAYVEYLSHTFAVLTLTSWAIGIFMSGFLLGFLFGIPRVLQRDDLGPQPSSDEDGYRQRVNTNLEQISDWLTKILVGLGLVQLRELPRQLKIASHWVAQSLPLRPGQADHANSFCTAIIVSFGILGFLAGYLLTRMYLAGAFRRADRPGNHGPLASPSSATSFDKTSESARLQSFVMPEGEINPANERMLVDWLKKKGLDVTWAGFLTAGQYRDERANALKDLGIQ